MKDGQFDRDSSFNFFLAFLYANHRFSFVMALAESS